jgi:hypothetical protein
MKLMYIMLIMLIDVIMHIMLIIRVNLGPYRIESCGSRVAEQV